MSLKIYLLLLISTVLFYAPILINPSILLNRHNDLEDQFWPIYHFMKDQIIVHHEIPLWNNLWFAGTPLLPDPQFSPIYLPHILFLVLPIGAAFIVSFILHTLVGAFGVYLASKKALGLSEVSSFYTSLLFIFSPKLTGYLEAGHPGLIESYSLIPYVILSTMLLSRTQKKIWLLLLTICLSGIFFLHTIVFLIALVGSLVLYLCSNSLKKHFRKNIQVIVKMLILGVMLTFGFTAITLLPQLEWSKDTTRFLLLSTRDVYPKWQSAYEFLTNVFVPWINGSEIWKVDSEKWLAIGLVTSIISLIGFLSIRRRAQVLTSIVVLIVLSVVLNNTSPIYSFLINQDWFVLMRVSTRLWIIVLFVTIFLSGVGMDKIIVSYGVKKANLIIFIAVLELTILSWSYIFKPIPKTDFAPETVYQFLSNDPTQFRVYCTTRCLSQRKSAEYGLQLVEGYNTIQQLNYYKESWQLMGGYWNYYTLSIPPFGSYTFEKNQPDPISLGEYNTKYVISPYSLSSKSFEMLGKYGNFNIYRNNHFLPRAYFLTGKQQIAYEAPVQIYTPNHIRVETNSAKSNQLTLSEVWSPGWNAYLDGKTKVAVQQKPNALRLVDLESNTKFVDFKYQPTRLMHGFVITVLTIALAFLCFKTKSF